MLILLDIYVIKQAIVEIARHWVTLGFCKCTDIDIRSALVASDSGYFSIKK